MTARLTPLEPHRAAELAKSGRAVIIDIREPDEFARRRAKGALSRPISAMDAGPLAVPPDAQVVFTCKSGMRTAAHCDRLAAAAGGDAYALEGGLDAWSAAGLPVESDAKAPLELMRQVQIAAGLIVLAGVVLGVTAAPAFLALSAFTGAGLVFAGASGWCGKARLLALAPWNRRAAH
jgi:rhodanese-related sulfurtransferase